MIFRNLFISLVIILTSCKHETTTGNSDISYTSFGDSITAENAISKESLLKKYQEMKEGDTINLKFSSKINDVCQKKGCWMNVDLGKMEHIYKI